MSMTNYEFLQTENRNDGVMLITINREEKLNAMNTVMMRELTDCFQQIHRSPAVRAVVLTGKNKAFMAGADIEQYNGFDIGQFFLFQDEGREMYRAIEACAQPVIAAINGYALGGGFELALACDLILASERAKFGLPEVNLGLVPGGGGAQRIARIVSPYLAKELLMSGRFLTASEGREWQFVNRVTAPEQLLDEALILAGELARRAPLAVQALKKLVDHGRDAGLESAQAYDRAYLANLFHSQDAREGIAAFVEKRKPLFAGK